MQPLQMQIHPVVEPGIDRGKPDGAAEIAHQVEQAGGVLHPLRRQRAERGIGHRNDREHQPDAAEYLRPQQFPEIPIRRE